jgi:hypothetical protein
VKHLGSLGIGAENEILRLRLSAVTG